MTIAVTDNNSKMCFECGTTATYSHWHRDSTGKGWLCKRCYNSNLYHSRPDQKALIRKRAREYYRNHKEQRCEYVQANVEKVKQYQQEYMKQYQQREYTKRIRGIKSEHPLNIKLMCQRCSWEWLYKGYNPTSATCPYCHTKVAVVGGGGGDSQAGF